MEKTNYELTNEIITKNLKNTKIVSNEGNTGTSYFEGKKRLCKIIKSKKNITLEINVNLNPEIEIEYNLQKITKQIAYQKHLGTLKYYGRFNDIKNLNKLIKIMVDNFKIEIENEKNIKIAK